MRRLIPGKTKVQIELFKGVLLSDIAMAAVFAVMLLFVVLSSLPYKGYICLAVLFVADIYLRRVEIVKKNGKYCVKYRKKQKKSASD